MVCVLGVKMHWCVHKLEVCCFIWISLVGIFFSFHFISFRLSTFNLIWYKCGIFSPCDVIIFDGSHRMQIDAIYIYLFFNVRCVRLCIITASICSRFPDKKKHTSNTFNVIRIHMANTQFSLSHSHWWAHAHIRRRKKTNRHSSAHSFNRPMQLIILFWHLSFVPIETILFFSVVYVSVCYAVGHSILFKYRSQSHLLVAYLICCSFLILYSWSLFLFFSLELL